MCNGTTGFDDPTITTAELCVLSIQEAKIACPNPFHLCMHACISGSPSMINMLVSSAPGFLGY